ncbi:ABC transporter ATP-binding protein [Niabella sp. CC-SYL272]|uniref:ABC transporter ATP-binding protein n=1 Tax=Niabella agricola TaxID=2891571 RepID=UPI001F16C337|nr:ABC transporter ATP-binding protein [Niabella agricola]MCF3108984.1 ABC transporter ATP-binding protein [Niabella agricola]
MISIQNISKRFGRLQVLDNLNLHLERGACIALTGPNGCGKTTLIKSILGMVLPDKGSIVFNGRDIKNDTLYRQQIGYMPQIGRYPENMTIGQILDMIQHIRNCSEPADYELFHHFNIAGMLQKKMRTLSGGTTQKVSATLAFLFRPPVLILDEPTAGLDPVAAEILKRKITEAKHKGSLILITSHLLSELEDLVTQIIFMQEGKLLLHQDIAALKTSTGQNSIKAALVHLLKNGTA